MDVPTTAANKNVADHDLQAQIVSVLKGQPLSIQMFTKVQALTVPEMLRQKDVIVQSPTGSGKTLAYLVPLCEMLIRCRAVWPPQDIGALVLVPNRELAVQVFDVAESLTNALGLTLLRTTGGVPVADDVNKVQHNGSNVFIATPGRLDALLSHVDVSSRLRRRFRALKLLVVDEADRLLDIGFQEQLSRILDCLPKQRRTALFSATQCAQLEEMMKFGLRNVARIAVDETKNSTDRGNDESGCSAPIALENFYTVVPNDRKFCTLLSFMKAHRAEKLLIFFGSCACVDYFHSVVHRLWVKNRPPLLAIHGKKRKKRAGIFARFRGLKDGGVLLCTDVMARGIDIVDIDWVVQMEPPKKSSWFVHRAGRAGRAGRRGSSLLLLSPSELEYIEYLRRHENVRIQQIQPIKLVTTAKRLRRKMRKLAVKDRSLLLKGTRAFCSYVQAYSKHDCQFVCSLKELDVVGVAHDFALMRLPKMPELCGRDLSSFERAKVNTSAIAFRDADREMQRQNSMRQRRSDAADRRARMQQNNIEAGKRRKRRRTNPAAWNDTADDYKLMKLLKRGKITNEEFDEKFMA